MHMHQLGTLYQNYGFKNSQGSFGVTEVKRSFSRIECYNSFMLHSKTIIFKISSRSSTYVMGSSKVNIGSFGVTGVILDFH